MRIIHELLRFAQIIAISIGVSAFFATWQIEYTSNQILGTIRDLGGISIWISGEVGKLKKEVQGIKSVQTPPEFETKLSENQKQLNEVKLQIQSIKSSLEKKSPFWFAVIWIAISAIITIGLGRIDKTLFEKKKSNQTLPPPPSHRAAG